MAAATQRVASYARELAALVSTPGVNEQTYCPALQNLLAGLLRDRALPFQVRVGTSQYRPAGASGGISNPAATRAVKAGHHGGSRGG
jgi:hypothetical protein